MIRVRFPNGQCVQYNSATDTRRDTCGGTEIVRKEGEARYWVAYIPAGTDCLVEWVMPCSVTNPIAELKPDSALKTVMQHLRALPGYDVKRLKLALRDFNAKQRCWRS